MTQKRFNVLIREQIDACLAMLSFKGEEYAPDVDVEAPVGDRLAHFKRAAGLQGITIEQAAFGMLAKHLASLAEMCETPDDFEIGKWTEKLTDSINYLLILSAVVSRDQPAANIGAPCQAAPVRGGLAI